MSGLAALWWRWRDERRRTRKRLPQLMAADVVFASHAKSGRTWLRAMISHALHRTRGVPVEELIDFDNFHRLDPGIPRVYFTSDYNEPAAIRRRLERFAREKRLLLMVRDPRDVVVSYWHHHRKRSSPRVRARLGMPADLSSTGLAEFVRAERYGLPSVIDFLDRWAAIAFAHPRAHLVRYEDLRARPVEELARVVEFLGVPAPQADLEAAVAFTSFEALREKERSGFYRSERLQARDPGDPESFKVRRGKVGGYRDELPPETVAWLDRTVAERLDPRLGYATPPPPSPPSEESRTAASM